MRITPFTRLCLTGVVLWACDSGSAKDASLPGVEAPADTGSLALDTGTDTGEPRDTTEPENPCEGEASAIDADGDGLLEWEEANGLDSSSPDEDGDGECDGEQDFDADGLSNAKEEGLGTDPLAADTDGDGMPDEWEVLRSSAGLDPLDGSDGAEDPDEDGLNNLDEFQNNTNPSNRDTDGDGYPDGYEVSRGSDASPKGTDSLPAFDAELTCTSASVIVSRTFVFDDDPADGFDDLDVSNYYGGDYERNHPGAGAQECYCTMKLSEEYGRVEDMFVFTPVEVHNNSPWDDSRELRPAIAALKVPFATGGMDNGAFKLTVFSNSDISVDGRKTTHWISRRNGRITSGTGVIDISGTYEVWVSVRNPAEDALIYRDDEAPQDACRRLSGNDTFSGYTGFLKIGFEASTPRIAEAEGSAEDTASVTAADSSILEREARLGQRLYKPFPIVKAGPDNVPQSVREGFWDVMGAEDTTCADARRRSTDFWMVPSQHGRQNRFVMVSGDDGYTGSKVASLSISDWSNLSQVRVHQPGIAPTILTENAPAMTLKKPVWLHQLKVEYVRSQSSSSLLPPTIQATHTCTVGPAPVPPGRRFPLSWTQLDAFLTAANGLLSVSGLLPNSANMDAAAFEVRIAEREGQVSWLHIGARGSGNLLSLPMHKASPLSWEVRHSSSALSIDASLHITTSGDLSLSLLGGSYSSLTLGAASLTLSEE